MKLFILLSAGCLSAALIACGGGGSGSGAVPISQAPASLDMTDFLGNWIRNDSASCFGGPAGGFDYGTYYFRNDRITFTASTLEDIKTLYSDINCATAVGTLSEVFAANFSAGTVAGKTNVARLSTTYTGSSSRPLGPAPLTFTKVPDGSLSGGNVKALLDVENNNLFVNARTSPRDAEGYPTTLQATATYHR